MPRLKDRNKQIPNGFSFYQPETKWASQRWSSFSTIVQSLISHRKANPFLVQKNGWSTDINTVSDEVDFYNASICQRMGWNDYITADGGQPASLPFQNPSQSLLKRGASVVAGAKTLVEWINSGEEAVTPDVANSRAEVCNRCPLNTKGDLSKFFTVPAAEAVRAAISKRSEWKLSTSWDAGLGICDACGCVLKLKVHIPIERIKASMTKETQDALDKDCWVRAGK